MFVVTVVLSFLTRSVLPPASWGTRGLSGILIFGVAFLAFPLVGALIASRRPQNPIGWICLAAGTIWMLANLTSGYGVYGLLARPGSVPFPAAIGSLGVWMWAPAVGLITYLILLFPDGKLPSMRWRPLAWLSGAVIILVSLRHRPHARTAARPRGCAQPVRARGVPLGSGGGARRYPATPPVHTRLGFKLGVALRSFWG
jgi:hypothetical protein